MSELRVLITEDEPLIAADIAAALTAYEFHVSGIAYSYEEAEHELATNLPDIVLLDINLHGNQEGIGLAQLIHEKYHIPFVFLTSYSDKATVNQAKTTEPSGYLVKPFTDASLYTSLEVAWYNHQQNVSKSYPKLNMDKINRNLLPGPALSEREFEVLDLIYAGKSNQQIAAGLFVSGNTIKKHINNAYLKLDAPTRTAAIARLRELNSGQ